MSDVTRLLQAIQDGDTNATDRLLPIVYEELRRLATSKMAHEAPDHTLQATALVHEAYLRLVGDWGSTSDTADTSKWAGDTPADAFRAKGRNYFFAAASEAMRRILVENARSKRRLKRGGDRNKLDLEGIELAAEGSDVDLIALDDALTRLEKQDDTKAEIVKLRYFTGLTIQETADALELSPATVKRQWAYARAWLRVEMSEHEDGAAN